jgi:hypothetical protein
MSTTPQSKRGAQQLKNYASKVMRAIGELTPWSKDSHRKRFERAVAKTGGQVVVMLDGNDFADDPLYKDATIG